MSEEADLPAGWELAPAGEITAEGVEQRAPSGSETFRYIAITSVDNRRKEVREAKELYTTSAPSRARQVVEAGDVLVSMTRPNLNSVALVPPDLQGSIASTGFHVLRASGVDPRWLLYLVQTRGFVARMSNSVQGVLYPAVRPRDIRAFPAPLPPLAEQRRIVAEIEKHFTRLDAAAAALERARANLKRYRASVLKAACEGRLVPTEAELARAEGRRYEPADELLARILQERRARWEADQLAKMQAAGKAPKDDAWKAKYVEPRGPDTSILPALPEGWCLDHVGSARLFAKWTSFPKLGVQVGGH